MKNISQKHIIEEGCPLLPVNKEALLENQETIVGEFIQEHSGLFAGLDYFVGLWARERQAWINSARKIFEEIGEKYGKNAQRAFREIASSVIEGTLALDGQDTDHFKDETEAPYTEFLAEASTNIQLTLEKIRELCQKAENIFWDFVKTPEGRQILKEERIPFAVNWLGWSVNELLTPKEIKQKTAETASDINFVNQPLVDNFLRQLSQDSRYENELQNWASTIKGEILIPEGSRLASIQMILLGFQQNPTEAVNAMPEKLRNIWNKMPEHKKLAKEIASFVGTAKGKINEKYFSHSNQKIHWACMDKDGKIYDLAENEAVDWLFETISEKTGVSLSERREDCETVVQSLTKDPFSFGVRKINLVQVNGSFVFLCKFNPFKRQLPLSDPIFSLDDMHPLYFLYPNTIVLIKDNFPKT